MIVQANKIAFCYIIDLATVDPNRSGQGDLVFTHLLSDQLDQTYHDDFLGMVWDIAEDRVRLNFSAYAAYLDFSLTWFEAINNLEK